MTDRELSVTAAARNFADAVNRAYYRHETTVLLKNGVPVARIAPIAAQGRPGVELAAEWDRLPHLSAADAAGVAADIAGARDAIQLPPATWTDLRYQHLDRSRARAVRHAGFPRRA